MFMLYLLWAAKVKPATIVKKEIVTKTTVTKRVIRKKAVVVPKAAVQTQPKIEVFTLPSCVFCHRAKKLLKKRNLSFVEYDLKKYPDKLAIMRRLHYKTVPAIFFDGRLIGGYDQLCKMDRQGQLNGTKAKGTLVKG